ncbi:hypothetical protein B0H12DRAFT_1238948 [Mycena haematopus]|nr:hypothetical protein B0H12DRAFT_1239581 [Mycena haematopus]KAJ7234906.1 hypothetical protein B0H12DRAFT_1238948 [Mycena haematopus]
MAPQMSSSTAVSAATANASNASNEVHDFLESFSPSLVHLESEFLQEGIRKRRDLIEISICWPREQIVEFFALHMGLKAVVAQALAVRLKDNRCLCGQCEDPLPRKRSCDDEQVQLSIIELELL